jgi:hypothetical protein
MEDDYCKKDILTEVAISAVEGLHYAEDRLRSLAFQVEFGKQPTEKDQERIGLKYRGWDVPLYFNPVFREMRYWGVVTFVPSQIKVITPYLNFKISSPIAIAIPIPIRSAPTVVTSDEPKSGSINLKKSIRAESKANKDYLKHAKGKQGKYLKEIARDERDHLKKHKKHLKKLEDAEKQKTKKKK